MEGSYNKIGRLNMRCSVESNSYCVHVLQRLSKPETRTHIQSRGGVLAFYRDSRVFFVSVTISRQLLLRLTIEVELE